MSTNATLSDYQWSKILAFLRECPRAYVGKVENCRLFIEAVHWIARSGAQWRFLPEKYGKWNSVYKRFARWCDHNIWAEMHQYFADDPDMESIMVDSTVIRAHPCAAGASQKKAGKINKHLVGAAEDSAPKSM